MNADDFKLLMDTVAETVANLVAPVIAENKRLSAEVKGLASLLDDVAEMSETVNIMGADVKLMNETYTELGENIARDITGTQTVLDDLGKRFNGLSEAVKALSDTQAEHAGYHEDAADRWDKLDIKGEIETHWDEVGRHECAAMMPDDWQPAIETLRGEMNALSLTPGPKGDPGLSPTVETIVEAMSEEVGKQIGLMVDDQLPALIPAVPAAKDITEDVVEQFQPFLEGMVSDLKHAAPSKDDIIAELGDLKGADGDTPSELRIAQAVMDTQQFRDIVRDAMPDPVAGPPGEVTDLQVQEAVKALWPSIRQSMLKTLPQIAHRGVYEPDKQYDVGDEVIMKGSTFRLIHPTDEAPPHDGWQMISQGKKGPQGKPGTQGDKGDPGERGDDGVGISDIVIAEGKTMVIELTDGTVKDLDLTEFVETVIKTIGE